MGESQSFKTVRSVLVRARYSENPLSPFCLNDGSTFDFFNRLEAACWYNRVQQITFGLTRFNFANQPCAYHIKGTVLYRVELCFVARR